VPLDLILLPDKLAVCQLAVQGPTGPSGAVSTYETDYVLVKDSAPGEAVAALRAVGHCVELPA
jgi:hypothetical protein